MRPPHRLWLLQEAVDFDLATSAEVDAAADDYRDDEAGGHGGAIAGGVLLGGVEGCAEFGGVVGIEHCGLVVCAVPDFRGDGPDDGVFVAVRGDGRSRAGICELVGRGTVRFELSVHERIVPEQVVAGGEVDVAVPVSHCAVSFASHANPLGDGVALGVKFSHLVAINHIEHGVLGGLEQKMTMRSGLIGEQRGTAGADVGITCEDVGLIERGKVIADGEG